MTLPDLYQQAIVDAASQAEKVKASAIVHQTKHDGGQMIWHQWGTVGEPLVLLHGGHGSWLHWIANVLPLAQHYQVFAADTPGLGASDAVDLPVTPQSLGKALYDGLLSLIDTTPFHVAGFSFGGLLSGQVAQLAKAQCLNMVLVGASGTGLPRPAMRLIRQDPEWSRKERFDGHYENLTRLMLSSADKIDPMALYIHDVNEKRAKLKSRKISLGDSLAQALHHIHAKPSGIWGYKDITAAPWINARRQLLRSHRPEARFYTLDAGHWVQYEKADEFNKCLIGILDHCAT